MDTINILLTCPMCGESHEVEVDLIDWLDYDDGELVVNAFPYLTPTEREQIISGICPKCQVKNFGY